MNRQISPRLRDDAWPRLVGMASLSFAVHHALVIVEIPKCEKSFGRVGHPLTKPGLVLIPKIGSEWPAGAMVNQTIIVVDPSSNSRGPNGLVPTALDERGAWSKAEMACCKRADLHRGSIVR